MSGWAGEQWMDRRMDGWVGGRVGGRMSGWIRSMSG